MSSPALNPSDSVEPRVQQGDEVVATTAQSETVLMDDQIPVRAEVEIAFDQTVPSSKTALASTGHYPADSSSSSNAKQLDSSGDLSTSCELDQSSGGYVAGDEATDSGSEISSFDISSLDVSMSSTSGPGADESSPPFTVSSTTMISSDMTSSDGGMEMETANLGSDADENKLPLADASSEQTITPSLVSSSAEISTKQTRDDCPISMANPSSVVAVSTPPLSDAFSEQMLTSILSSLSAEISMEYSTPSSSSGADENNPPLCESSSEPASSSSLTSSGAETSTSSGVDENPPFSDAPSSATTTSGLTSSDDSEMEIETANSGSCAGKSKPLLSDASSKQ